jgi:hypothetical protein
MLARMLRRAVIPVVALTALGMVLAACTATGSPVGLTTTPSDDESVSTTGLPPPPAVGAAACGNLDAPAAPGDVEQLGGLRLQTPRDLGPRAHAEGEVVQDASGTPVAYIVAADDNAGSITARFCLTSAYLHAINAVRRPDLRSLYIGDTVNLDAHTILTVGDQNGIAESNDASSPLPPQR